ncbi:MAG: hypothetical protein ACR2JP_05625 [Acidimicrobiia bacterium]
MRTVSLRARVVVAGVAVVALVVAGLDVFVYASMRDRLLDNLEALLDDRAELVVELSGALDDRELVERLAGSGVTATVEGPEGGRVRAGRPFRRSFPSPRPSGRPAAPPSPVRFVSTVAGWWCWRPPGPGWTTRCAAC